MSFLPIFALEAQEGRLFKPLAYTKTFSMAAAALLSVTLVPALMIVFVRGRIIPEQKNPINRFLIWLYRPIIKAVLRAKTLTILLALAVVAVTVWPASQIGSEFMPTLNEGTLFYMPTTLPGISVTKAAELLQMQDRIIKSFPEVESVFGKAGRASTATDPAPIEMSETVINLKPKNEWRPGMTVDSPDRAKWTRRCSFPACRTPGPCRSRRASTCCRPASAPRSALRCSAPISARSKRSPARSSRSSRPFRAPRAPTPSA